MKTNIKFILMVLCGVLCIEAHAQSSHWQFDAYAYRYDMTAYVSLSIDGEMVTDYSDYEIAAFCDEECRGIASVQKVEKDGTENSYGYLRIRSNQDTGETITFKAFKVSTNQEMNVYNTSIVFRSQQVVGLPSTPMIIPVVHFSVSVSCDETMGTVSGGGVYEAGTTATLTATPIEGYHFANWSDGEEANPYEFTVTEDISLSASFAPSQYTMTFVLDNGEENVVKTQDYGTELTAPADPTKKGFTFKGWSPEVPATIPASDQTFTAQWERNSYKLSWDVDGVKTENMVLYEAPITKPADPEKDGYTFAGWTPEVAETMPAEDVTYTATWTVNQYTMTFVLDNGEENVVKTQDFNSALTAPAAPAKEGFTFKGWNPEVPTTVPAQDMTFTAQWERNSYTLKFIVDGVTVKEETLLFEAAITAPEDPTKEGYTFTGWNPAVPETMPAHDVTCTAQFQINQYTMTFVLDNGEDNVVKTQDYGTELTAPEDPVKEGFTFKGWSPEVPATVPAQDMTFTAQWERNSYTLKFIVDGETVKEETLLFEAAITAPEDPTKEGYTFTGWNPAVPETMPAYDVTCTAQFQINQYTMTFVLDNGEDNVVKTQDYGTELTAPEDPVKEGFTFKGWSPEVPATVPAQDMTFTAQWERNSYTLKFIVDGVTVKEETVLFEAAISAPEDPTKEGYTFTGWNPTVPETMPAHDVTCTAQFTINQYTMTFVLDNGQENVVKVQDFNSALSAPEDPVKEGFTFKGWNPEVPATVPAQDMTFTAQWERNSYTLTFVVDGVTVKEETVLYEASITAPEDPTKEGYTFTGWNPAVPETMPAHDVTCTAQFTVNTYYVIYMVNGEEWVRDPVEYGAPIVLREYPVEPGSTFSGWQTDEEYETMPAHDVVYTAELTTGISAIPADVRSVNVYHLNGTLMYHNVSVQQIKEQLPKGVYIILGKKYVVK